MLFTVPGLKDYGEDAFVEPDVPMRDDGKEGAFAKAYIRDEIPWFDLRHEVRDLMILAVPNLAGYDEASFTDADIPEDGMEACWAEETESVAAVEQAIFAIAPAEGAVMVSAPQAVALLAMPEEAPVELPELTFEDDVGTMAAEPVEETPFTEPMEAAAESAEEAAIPLVVVSELMESVETPEETVLLPETDLEEVQDCTVGVPETVDAAEASQIPEEPESAGIEEITVIGPVCEAASEAVADEVHITEDSPAVRFSFGHQEVQGRGWRVCFSF